MRSRTGVIDGQCGPVLPSNGRFLEIAPNAPASGDTLYGYADLTFSF